MDKFKFSKTVSTVFSSLKDKKILVTNLNTMIIFLNGGPLAKTRNKTAANHIIRETVSGRKTNLKNDCPECIIEY